MEKIKIVIATHKPYKMPEDEMYIPLLVGAKCRKEKDEIINDCNYQRDDQGENISELNPYFCELTAMYWMWKNLEAEYVGLVHYRRHFFVQKKYKDNFKNILKRNEIEDFLDKKKVFLPKKREYYIESLYSHYSHTHYESHLILTRKIINELYPEYIKAYDEVIHKSSGYIFNMMIMKKELMDSYCEWLFSILFKIKETNDFRYESDYQNRYYGRISELIFNVWLKYQIDNNIIKKDEIMELKYLYTEKVDWLKKVCSFLKAKFMRKRYKGSF